MLPHAFPFRLVDHTGGDAADRLAWTVGGALDRGAGAAPAMLAVEMMAQSALVLLAREGGEAGGAGEGAGLLAGVDGLVFHSAIGAGDRLEAHAAVAGRFGRLVKVSARLTRDGAVVAEGDLLLALG